MNLRCKTEPLRDLGTAMTSTLASRRCKMRERSAIDHAQAEPACEMALHVEFFCQPELSGVLAHKVRASPDATSKIGSTSTL
jgi:hypothetical protein